MSKEDRQAVTNNYLSVITAVSRSIVDGKSARVELPAAQCDCYPVHVMEEDGVMDTSNGVIQGNFDDRNETHHPMEETDNRETQDQLGVPNVNPSIGNQDAARTYDAPKILVQPKPECKDRNLRDLVLVQRQKGSEKTGKSKEKVCSNSKRCPIGLLPGIGPQRTLPQVEVKWDYST